MADDLDEPSPEIIEMMGQTGSNPVQLSLVAPGPETKMLVGHLALSTESTATLLQEAQRILLHGPHVAASDDAQAKHETGLIIGYVQSGKTMSFTTVTALARDNKYRMVIVIAGTSVPLLNQSEGRLDKDLQLDRRPDRKWLPFKNPAPGGSEGYAIRDALDEWKDASLPEAERQTVLITVMKNARHLENLVEVLQALDLHGVPTLIVDDEADQAGLNTRVKQGGRSAVYQKLLNLRNAMPDHLYLQYTATPQAPLLISLIDTLSPGFAELLTPGPEYAGGNEFFKAGSRLVCTIPDDEIPTKGHRLPDPPSSLLEAMRIFFLGVAAGLVLDEGKGNRSMMVHPSQVTLRHAEYMHWVTQVKDQWQQTLGLSPGDPDLQDLLAVFEESYRDLQVTVPNLPTFDVLIGRLLHAIRKTRIEEINATRGGKTPDIDWRVAYPWILVGGQAMDRGYTVEGLTVTYMPRSIGTGNADTIQQRARFFGYKQNYLGYCRVYLDGAARDAYKHYVVHEEDIREQLTKFRDTGKPLADWKREFFLDRKLKPTRDNVLKLGYMRGKFNEQWHTQDVPHEPQEAVEANHDVVRDFLAKLRLTDDPGHPNRTETQRHKMATNVPLSLAYEDLLIPLRTPNLVDSQLFTRLRLQIDAYLSEHPGATCTIFYMGGGIRRIRALKDEKVENVFQGAYPTDRTKERIYAGDRELKAEQGVTIQIRTLDIRDHPEFTDIPAIAVWIPKEMAGYDVLVQDQGGHP
jgi:hypothetical protein